MTTPCRSGASFPRFSDEMGGLCLRREAASGSGLGGAGLRAPAAPTFAACLDVLGKELRARGDGGLAGPVMATGAQQHPASAALPPEAAATATSGDSDPPTGRGDDREGVLSASDARGVGRDATIDPIVPILVSLAARGASPAHEAAARPEVRAPHEHLMARLVRRIAWSGNARTGSARLEFGAGELEGATLTVHADDGVVRVALELPPGVDRAAWKERISGRLGARGLQVEEVDVA